MWKSSLLLSMFMSSIVLIINIDHYNYFLLVVVGHIITMFFSFDPFLTWVGSLNRSDKTLRNVRFFVASFALYVIMNEKPFDKMSLTFFVQDIKEWYRWTQYKQLKFNRFRDADLELVIGNLIFLSWRLVHTFAL